MEPSFAEAGLREVDPAEVEGVMVINAVVIMHEK